MDYTSFDKNPDFSDAEYSVRNKKQRPHRNYKPGKARLENIPSDFYPSLYNSPNSEGNFNFSDI